MKLEVEIKDETFHYTYTIGGSKHTASMPLTRDNFVAFSELLKFTESLSFRESRHE